MGARLSRSSASRPPTPPITGVPVLVGTAVSPAASDATSVVPDGKKKEMVCTDGPQQLDLVFTMDCTGSMGTYILAAKKNIEAIAERLAQSEGYDLRFALVAYRDHPPQDQTYVTKKFPFTHDVGKMKHDLTTLSAQGGGDGPEAVAAALKQTLDCDWRPNATKVCILIADAPPHGLGESGDGFPNGAPDGIDPFEVLSQMSMRGICIYSVGCEPALSRYLYAKAFFVAAAQKTNGQAVSLRSAAALADVIMGGAIEEMDLQQHANEVVEEVQRMRAERPKALFGETDGYDSEEERAVAWEVVQSRGHQTRHLKTKKLKAKGAGSVSKVSSLSEARATLRSAAHPARIEKKTALSRAEVMASATCESLTSHCESLTRASTTMAKSSKRQSLPLPKLPAAPAFFRFSGSVRSELSPEHDVRPELCLERDMSSSSGSGSDYESDEDEAAAGGARLETRSLSFGQVKRIYNRSKAAGLL